MMTDQRIRSHRRSSLTDLTAEAHLHLLHNYETQQQQQQQQQQHLPPQVALLNLPGKEGIAFSDNSIDSDEEMDKVGLMSEEVNTFRQLDYLFLFDQFLKFSERPNFTLDDASVQPEDFQQMRHLNRLILSNFVAKLEQSGKDVFPAEPIPAWQDDSHLDHSLVWADENLDEELKAVLANYENGRLLPVDMVSHMEYFYNTLDCCHHAKNPFSDIKAFPALSYKDPAPSSAASSNLSPQTPAHGELTLFQKHRALIYPNSASEFTSDVSPHGGSLNLLHQFSSNQEHPSQSQGSHQLLPKKYHWYPNMSIVSPKCSRVSISPSPKEINSNSRRLSCLARQTFTSIAEKCPEYQQADSGTGGEESKYLGAPPRVSMLVNLSSTKQQVSSAQKGNGNLCNSALKKHPGKERQRRGTVLDVPISIPRFDLAGSAVKHPKKKSLAAHLLQESKVQF